MALSDLLKHRRVMVYTAVELLLPARPGHEAYALRLLDAASEVTLPDGRTFRGRDPVFGKLADHEAVEEGFADSAPTTRIAIHPASEQALERLAHTSAQGAQVNIYAGAIVVPTGVVPEPTRIFVGRFQKPERSIGRAAGVLELQIASWWEAFFVDDEGFKLNNGFHQKVHPGELGLEFIVDVARPEPWGAEGGRPAVVRDTMTRASPYSLTGG